MLNLNKKISSLTGILIIILMSSLAAGFIVWDYWSLSKIEEIKEEMPIVEYHQYRKEIVIDNIGNPETFIDYQISFNFDTLSLIRDGKLSFDCSDIKFIDSDGQKEIPYWMESCSTENDEIWLRIPEISPDSKKSIYIYYGNENKLSQSSFYKVFSKINSNLVAWYYSDKIKRERIIDFSGNNNDGVISRMNYETLYIPFTEERNYLFFNNWGGWKEEGVYFNVPASESLNFDKSQGSIEMWLRPYKTKSDDYQRLVIDTDWQIELGIHPNGSLYFYPSQAGGNNYNMITSPLKSDSWSHLTVVWNFQTKEVNFYINGEKKKNNIENVSKYWKELAKTGDWQFGGTSLDIESAYAGYIDGIKIYNKALTEKEVKNFYRYNKRDLRHPEISFGEEELISGRSTEEVFNYSIIEGADLTDKIDLSMFYAAPVSGEYTVSGEYIGYKYFCEGRYIDPQTKENLFLISKHKNEYLPIFGVPSHFFPYEGTSVDVKDSFLLYYIGLKIDNFELIKNLKIEFKEIENYDYGKDSYFNKLIPSAHACGPFYYYKVVGDSELSLIEKVEGVYWYKLETPIFVDKNTTMAQFYYFPSGKEGIFSIQVSDMIFKDEENNYVRPTFSKDPQKIKYYDVHGDIVFVDNYLAYFTSEEKGFITFNHNLETNNLDLCFENHGKDQIIIDDQSIANIETQSIKWRVKGVNIEDKNRNIIYSISMNEIEESIFNKTIKPDQEFRRPFLSFNNLSEGEIYYINISTGEETKFNEITNQKEIIRWIFGDSPYYYSRHHLGDKLYLYTLEINSNGLGSIKKIPWDYEF